MIKRIFFAALALAASAAYQRSAEAVDLYGVTDAIAYNYAVQRPWHGPYYHTEYGLPVAQLVPPTAHMQTNFAWGVSQNTMYPIWHQFERPVPGYGVPAAAARGFLPTPRWPSHTDQFGVYYVRGPW